MVCLCKIGKPLDDTAITAAAEFVLQPSAARYVGNFLFFFNSRRFLRDTGYGKKKKMTAYAFAGHCIKNHSKFRMSNFFQFLSPTSTMRQVQDTIITFFFLVK